MENMKIGRILGILLILSSLVFAVDISDCANLTTENTTYTLTTNVVQAVPTCFVFEANNITLDCAGYSTTLNSLGISIDSVNHSTVKNCVFPSDAFADNLQINVTNASNVVMANSIFSCVLLNEVNNATLTYLNVTDQNCRLTQTNQYAISLHSVNNSIIANCRMFSQGTGVGVGNNYSLRIDNKSYSNQIFNNYFMLDWNLEGLSGQTGCPGGDDAGIGNSYIYIEPGAPLSNSFNTTLQEGTRVTHPRCTGTAVPCSSHPFLDCSGYPGCSTDGIHLTCVGTAVPCSQIGNSGYLPMSRCSSGAGCSYEELPVPGILIGGNYYERQGCNAFGLPDTGGLSNLCADADQNGLCDSAFGLSGSAYACSGTAFCSYPTPETCTDGLFNPICNWAGTTCNGTCTACPDLSFDEGTCNAQLGCSWNGTACNGTCTECTTILNFTDCVPQLGCGWTGSLDCHTPQTCGDLSDENCTCAHLTAQTECQNQTGCSWGLAATHVDFYPLSNKYLAPAPGGMGGLLGCFDGTVLGQCSKTTNCEQCTLTGLIHSDACCAKPSCGDGLCNGDETTVSCPADCRSVSEVVVRDIVKDLTDIRLFFGIKYTFLLLLVLALVAASLYEFKQGRQPTGAILLVSAGFLTLLAWNSIYLWG